MEPPEKKPHLSNSEATEDDEIAGEEFNIDDSITEEVLMWYGCYGIM